MLTTMICEEFEAFAESIADVDVQYRPMDMKRPQWSLQFVNLPGNVHMQAGSEGGRCMAMGAKAPDSYMLLHRGWSAVQRISNGIEQEPGSVFAVAPGAEFCIVDGSAVDWVEISLPIELVETTDEFRWLTGITDTRGFEASSATEAVWSLAVRFIRSARMEPGVLTEPASLDVLFDDLRSTLDRLGMRQPDLVRRPLGRPRIADQRLIVDAVELIRDLPDRIATIKDLVTATGVPERTLRDGFHKYLGVSPRRFIELSRLYDARCQLTRPAHDDVTVSQVAASVGMWDFGRFAQRYRAVFGELPSQTLVRAMG